MMRSSTGKVVQALSFSPACPPSVTLLKRPAAITEDCYVRLLSNLLRRFIRQGTLRVRDADGKVHVFGERLPGPDVAIHLHDRKLYNKLFINPELYAAEAYMDGALTLGGGSQIHDFLLLFSVNRAGLYSYGSQRLMRRVWRGLRRWHQGHPIGGGAPHFRPPY